MITVTLTYTNTWDDGKKIMRVLSNRGVEIKKTKYANDLYPIIVCNFRDKAHLDAVIDELNSVCRNAVNIVKTKLEFNFADWWSGKK